jgi:hypothetical protein
MWNCFNGIGGRFLEGKMEEEEIDEERIANFDWNAQSLLALALIEPSTYTVLLSMFFIDTTPTISLMSFIPSFAPSS